MAIAASLFASVACTQTPLKTTGALEFIRVAADRWTFKGASSGTRFIPFGSNLVWHYPAGTDKAQGLDILVRPQWDPEAVRQSCPVRPLEHCTTGANESQFRMRNGQSPCAAVGRAYMQGCLFAEWTR